ncbi:MAG: hypothetical protein D6714_09910 [Bacteroidetes bacterium]|nr:MAG: hypothetical protein D6714_09910 [Bacteroidota bacterium]
MKRNRLISDLQKAGYYNLIKLARKTFQIKTGIGYEPSRKLREDFEKMLREIKPETPIFNQTWLQHQMDNVRKRLDKTALN